MEVHEHEFCSNCYLLSSSFCYRQSEYAPQMEPDKVKFRQQRLLEASQKAGSKAALGVRLGYRDGSPVGQMIRGERPITEKTVALVEALDGFAGWFADEVGGWPFSQELYRAVARLNDEDRFFAENALRSHLRMEPLPRSNPGEDAPPLGTGTHGP